MSPLYIYDVLLPKCLDKKGLLNDMTPSRPCITTYNSSVILKLSVLKFQITWKLEGQWQSVCMNVTYNKQNSFMHAS